MALFSRKAKTDKQKQPKKVEKAEAVIDPIESETAEKIEDTKPPIIDDKPKADCSEAEAFFLVLKKKGFSFRRAAQKTLCKFEDSTLDGCGYRDYKFS